jgi:flagellar protein FlaJ
MKIRTTHIVGMILGALLLSLDLLFLNNMNLFIFLIGLAFGVVTFPFVIELIFENKRSIEINETFLEFSRNISESVKAGTPVSKSIINLKERNYGALSPHVIKLANQISVGIPVSRALETFAYEVDNPVVSRAVVLIREAEKAGGEIEAILESSAKSIAEIEKLRKERKATISSLVVQGYLIFFIFIGIMLVMEYNILPLTANVGETGMDFSNINLEKLSEISDIGTSNNTLNTKGVVALFSPFLFLLLVQGLFAGLIIGKVTEGTVKSGIKHSFILIMAAFLISSGVKLIF